MGGDCFVNDLGDCRFRTYQLACHLDRIGQLVDCPAQHGKRYLIRGPMSSLDREEFGAPSPSRRSEQSPSAPTKAPAETHGALTSPILVFPGGAREIGKGKDQLNTLQWGDRAGFARLAIEHNYPIVTAAVVGGDDMYKILTTSDGTWAQLNKKVSIWLGSDADLLLPLSRGIGPTLLPRPQRLYARFSRPIDTTRPKGTPHDEWLTKVRETAKTDLESNLAALLAIRATDPFRNLAPWAWRKAVMPHPAQDR
ncbi:diacylglycerol acyltransferase family protein [Mycobacterium avium subsp. avium 2285 (R)]|nr:diacylglycerol acyltransferase family protein [Mycobacterium avium subsp. avium 2285 (R)]